MNRPGFTRKHAQAVAQAGQKKRQVTIANLITAFERKNHRTPTEAEIAGLLATTVNRVRFHLSQMKRVLRHADTDDSGTPSLPFDAPGTPRPT